MYKSNGVLVCYSVIVCLIIELVKRFELLNPTIVAIVALSKIFVSLE